MDNEKRLYTNLGAYLGKAGKMMEKRINEKFSQSEHAITLEHWIVLVHLWLKDGRNQKTLCEFAGRNKTTITRTIDSLEEQNFVVRVPDQTDRRNKLIYLTNKGKAAKTSLSNQMFSVLDEATQGISQEEIDICKKVLHRVFLNMADERALEIFQENSYNRNQS